MDGVKDIFMKRSPENMADYIAAYKKIDRKRAPARAGAAPKIALLSSFTINGIREVLDVKCRMSGLAPEFYVSPYNQYAQDVLSRDGKLYEFDPDLTILYIDTANLFGEDYIFPYRLSDEERRSLVSRKCEEISALVKAITERSRGKVVLHNFRVPHHSHMGILENKQKFGFREMVRALNSRLESDYKTSSRVYVFDYDIFCSKHGKENIIDNKMYYLGDIKLSLAYIPPLCEEYMSYIKPMMSLTKKCLVLDLDNTLWGGIIGEDGMEGIKLGPTPEGMPFLDFQKQILNLFERGVILALNSSNNPGDVMKVFDEHPYMILKKEHFSAMEVNWNDKISNMRAIAGKINIGLDALVFIDDDSTNREMVRSAMPEVRVVDLPEDPSDYVDALFKVNDFETFQITEEDVKRNRAYAAEGKRKEFKESSGDVSQYLKALEMVVTIEKANSFTIPRISQLTQKTNQFNMTTKRFMEEDIKALVNDDNHIVISAKVEDKFGDNGITGVAIVEKRAGEWIIGSFLLSCRVIGRKVEEAMLAYIAEQARREGAGALIGEFIPTGKNSVAKDFYKGNHFDLIDRRNGTEIWKRDLKEMFRFPDFIKVIGR